MVERILNKADSTLDVFLQVDIVGRLCPFEEQVGMQLQPRRGLPSEHEVRHNGRRVVVGIDVCGIIGRQLLREVQLHEVGLERMNPREVPVSRELRTLVTGHQFQTAGLVLSGIIVVEDIRHDEVIGPVVETIEFEVQSLHPVLAGEGKLEGVHPFR